MKTLEFNIKNDENIVFDIDDNEEVVFDTNINFQNVINADYELLTNKPAINKTELYKNTTLEDVGIIYSNNEDIESLF